MQINKRAVTAFGGALAVAASLIVNFEGYTNVQRFDPVGNTEICFGHRSNQKSASDDECITLLKKDIENGNAVLGRLVKVPLTEGQRAALIDFIYNLGGERFRKSTLLKKLNSGNYVGACYELTRCDLNEKTGRFEGWGCGYSSGKVLKGLVRRRAAEMALCLGES